MSDVDPELLRDIFGSSGTGKRLPENPLLGGYDNYFLRVEFPEGQETIGGEVHDFIISDYESARNRNGAARQGSGPRAAQLQEVVDSEVKNTDEIVIPQGGRLLGSRLFASSELADAVAALNAQDTESEGPDSERQRVIKLALAAGGYILGETGVADPEAPAPIISQRLAPTLGDRESRLYVMGVTLPLRES